MRNRLSGRPHRPPLLLTLSRGYTFRRYSGSPLEARFTPSEGVGRGRLRRPENAVPTAGAKGGRTPYGFYLFSLISAIYLTNCALLFPRDTNFTPKCSHSLQQFRCVLLLRTENVNVGVVCCRNIRMAKPLADYADRYARFQCPRSKGMSQLM